MVEHEVSVETTQVETATVTFCDFCGEPEDTAGNIETLFTASNGPKIVREDSHAKRVSTAWTPPDDPDRREPVAVSGRAGERLMVEYDTDGLAAACEACRERLGEGEIPNPGTVHRDATDPRDVPESPPGSTPARFGDAAGRVVRALIPPIPWPAAVGMATGACVAVFFLAAIADLPGVSIVSLFVAIAMLGAACLYGLPDGRIP